MSASIILPLKGTKPAELSNALLSYYADVTKSRPPEAAAAAARTLDQVRERLSSIKALSDTTADAAATELLAYERQLAALARRLDNAGAALNVRFIWRDAFRPKQKVEKGDLDWERVCTLFNAAAALGYAASRAFRRGAQADAFKQLQRAAGCFAAAHDMVRPAIWGLDPRWEPASLSPDLGLEMLSALRDLMLAQAQHAFHQKAVDEGTSPSVRAKLAEQAALLFGAALRTLDSQELRDYVTEEGSLFKPADDSWLRRLRAAEARARAIAQEEAAAAAAADSSYGAQVARLRLASELMRRAAAAAPDGSPERRSLEDESSSLSQRTRQAEQDNATIYQDPVPSAGALPRLEPKLFVKPIRPEDGVSSAQAAYADAFPALLPAATAAAVTQFHGEVHAKLHDLSTRTTSDAEKAQKALAELELPQALEACEADKRLPARLVRAIAKAQATGGVGVLEELLSACTALEKEAVGAATMANEVLKAEEEKDAALLSDEPRLTRPLLHALKTTQPLVITRSQLDTNRERLETALEVTAKLRSRHESSLREMGGLDAPLEELEARLPHLDGTPLEAEPCVEALRALLDQLEQLKAEAAAKVEAGRIRAPSRAEALAELGAALLCEGGSPPADGSGAAAAAMAPFDEVVSEYDALQRRREALLAAVAEQHALFVVARHAEENYAERQEYLGSLSHGADEMCAIHEGLTEGHRFYKVVLTELRKASEKGAEIADLREAERASLLRRMNEPPPTFTQATAQPAAAHAAPSSYAGGGASLAEARAAWQASHAGAGGASPPPTVPAARPTATAVPARPAPVPARAVATPVPAYSSAAAAAPAPKTIMCYGCRNKFGVPPNTAIVACPFCKTHNRVPP